MFCMAVFEAVDHAKYLGLEISHDLNWNTHMVKDPTFKLFCQYLNESVLVLFWCIE